MDRCDGLVEFLKVVETGSFSNAARYLKVSVAHISRQVSALESRLGTKLFIRTTRRVHPTTAGQHLALQCKPLLEELFRAQDNLLLANESIQGTIRLSGGSFVEQQVVPLLADFCATNPDVQIEIDLSNRTLDLLDGHLDFAVSDTPIEDSTIFVTRPFQAARMATLASPALVRQLETELDAPLEPTRVPATRCLGLSRRPWWFHRHEQVHIIEPAGPIASNSAQTLIRAAAAGVGLIHVPSCYVSEACQTYQLVPLFDDWSTKDSVMVNIVYVRNRYMPSRVRLLIEYLLLSIGDRSNRIQSALEARIDERCNHRSRQ